MIQIAAHSQSAPDLTNQRLGQQLSNPFLDGAVAPAMACNCAFVGYSNWRREENGDANLSDNQVLVVREGQAQFLKPRKDLVDRSPDRLGWGDHGDASTQLAVALLMEILNDWARVRLIYEEFTDCFVAQIPRNTNWTADGSDLMAMALCIEVKKKPSSEKSATNSSPTKTRSAQARGRGGQGRSESKGDQNSTKEETEPFLRALEVFRDAAFELSQTWEALEDDRMEESPLLDKYPFHKCFKELTSDICDWVEEFREWAEPT